MTRRHLGVKSSQVVVNIHLQTPTALVPEKEPPVPTEKKVEWVPQSVWASYQREKLLYLLKVKFHLSILQLGPLWTEIVWLHISNINPIRTLKCIIEWYVVLIYVLKLTVDTLGTDVVYTYS